MPLATELPTPVAGGSFFRNITSTTTIKSAEGVLIGIFVASASATPTIALSDATSGASPLIVNTFTPVSGTWYPLPFRFRTGLVVTISGTVDCTVSYT